MSVTTCICSNFLCFKKMTNLEAGISKTFLYFAYGSNMLSFRMKLNNLSAEFVSIARLDNSRLDFIRYSKFWGGPAATVVPTANAHVWGVIWRIPIDNLDRLNDQEGLERKIYYAKFVQVLTPYLGILSCRIYIQTINPLPIGDKDEIPVERWPSWTYRKVLILGAIEQQLPPYYIEMLKNIKSNGQKGCYKMYCYLMQYTSSKKSCLCISEKAVKKPLQLDLRKIRARKLKKAK
ncbi:gamma-glutamylcyclotransferase-like [Vanessa cardui]|uniref:gamma-glutamylcyclotransferase-like n=1 Tax=Vanessa cardui TaxID=171605 RepID=UPI001F144911|nr:gamma-glutamylcyclotransferase-like [Vanessa cardui]